MDRDKLILDNQKLVHEVAKTFKRKDIDYEDLFQEGLVGLINASKKFDPKKGYKFSTYAYHSIKNILIRFTNQHKKSMIKILPNDILDLIQTTKDRIDLKDEYNLTEEEEEILWLRFSKVDIKEIAEKFDTTPIKMSKIINKIKKKIARCQKEYSG